MDYLIKSNDFLLKLESRFDEKKALPWMHSNWYWSFIFSAIYLFLVLYGQHLMKNRKPFDLRRALCMWSTTLSVFSWYAVFRVVGIAYQMVYFGGIRHAMCDSGSYIGIMGGGLWAFLFPLSKLPELVDTAFIVLRKKKLSFLHTYHHISVFIYCWYSYAYPISTGIWFGMVNYFVHAIMYAYYAYTASGRFLPRWVAQCITIIQLSQMFVGVYINYVGITSLMGNRVCGTNWFAISISIFFYVSYAILFGNFFYQAYINKKPRPPTASRQQSMKQAQPSTSNGVANGSHASQVPNGAQPLVANGLHHRSHK